GGDTQERPKQRGPKQGRPMQGRPNQDRNGKLSSTELDKLVRKMVPDVTDRLQLKFCDVDLAPKKYHNGAKIVYVHIANDEYEPGMSTVAQDVLKLTNSDVLLMGVSYINKSKKASYQLASIIGRASASLDDINLNHTLGSLNGGGHPKAAAASIRMDRLDKMDPEMQNAASVEEILEKLVEKVCEAVPPVKCARELMTHSEKLVVCQPSHTMVEAMEIIFNCGYRTIPVVNEDGILKGVVSMGDLELQINNGLGKRPVKSCMRSKLYLARPEANLHDVEMALVEKGVGCIPVVEAHGGESASGESMSGLSMCNGIDMSQGTSRYSLLGMITRTDVLRQHAYYSTHQQPEWPLV
ncbi:hypothetical protein CYMTET_21810, partial [Cymbomonas tetramitiformis]